MFRRRGRVLTALAIFAAVVLGAAGVFAVQYAQANTSCGATPCAVSSPNLAEYALFVAIAGLAVAAVMGMTAGVSWSASAPPNRVLARQIEEEDAAFKAAQARKLQLEELRAMALAHARAEREAAEAAAAEAEAEAAASGALVAPAVDISPGVLQEDNTAETPDQARRRVLGERLKNLARNKPETVAEVLKNWINQPRLR